jgi:hypothetical protein
MTETGMILSCGLDVKTRVDVRSLLYAPDDFKLGSLR